MGTEVTTKEVLLLLRAQTPPAEEEEGRTRVPIEGTTEIEIETDEMIVVEVAAEEEGEEVGGMGTGGTSREGRNAKGVGTGTEEGWGGDERVAQLLILLDEWGWTWRRSEGAVEGDLGVRFKG